MTEHCHSSRALRHHHGGPEFGVKGEYSFVRQPRRLKANLLCICRVPVSESPTELKKTASRCVLNSVTPASSISTSKYKRDKATLVISCGAKHHHHSILVTQRMFDKAERQHEQRQQSDQT